MDFIILLGLKMIFDLLFPQKSANKINEPSIEAAFWYGTSYENIGTPFKDNFEKTQTYNESNESDYDNIW